MSVSYTSQKLLTTLCFPTTITTNTPATNAIPFDAAISENDEATASNISKSATRTDGGAGGGGARFVENQRIYARRIGQEARERNGVVTSLLVARSRPHYKGHHNKRPKIYEPIH